MTTYATQSSTPTPEHGRVLPIYRKVLWCVAIWSILSILLSVGSLHYVWFNPTYGGFLWSYESIERLYRPDDTYIHPAVADHLTFDTFILAVDGQPAHPQSITRAFNERWSKCPQPPPPSETVTYTIRNSEGDIMRTPPLPLLCFDWRDLLFQVLAVLPAALFFWLVGLTILRNTPREQDPYEQAFGLTSAFVFFGMGVFLGKQVYLEQGIETVYGWGMIMGTSLPTAVLLAPIVFLNTALIPPALGRQHKRQPLIILAILLWVVTILIINFILFYPAPLLSTSTLSILTLIHPVTWILINFGMLCMGMRGGWIAFTPSQSFYRRQGLGIALALIFSTTTILLVSCGQFFYADWDLFHIFPVQELLLLLTTLITLLVSIGLLNNEVLPQSNRILRWLPLFGIVAMAAATLPYIFKFFAHQGVQFALVLLIIALLVFLLRGNYPGNKLLDRLSNYRIIPAEGVESYLRATSRPQSLSKLGQTVVNELVALLNLRGASLWLADLSAEQFVLHSQQHHQPHQTTLPLTAPEERQHTAETLLPLYNGEQCVGLLILVLGSPNLTYDTPADKKALETIAAHTALVINRAQAIATARETAVAEQDIRLAERAELGRTLHDMTIQDLNNILLSLYVFDDDPRIRPIEDNLSRAVINLRDISNRLSEDETSPRTITAQLRYLLATRKAQHPAVQFETTLDELPALPPALARDFWLACRQAIDNALNHAQATHIHIALRLDNGANMLTFTVRDNGRGFNYRTLGELRMQGHNGLYNMESRLQRHKGQLRIESRPGAGTTISGRVPWPAG